MENEVWSVILRYAGVVCAGIGAALGWLYGPLTPIMYALLGVVIIDYITGVLKAFKNKCLSSSVGFNGILKKICIFLIVAVAALVDRAVPATNSAVQTAAELFYICNEGLSVLENAAGLGIALPESLRKALAQLGEKDKEEAEKMGGESLKK